MTMATKHGRLVTYNEELPSKKLQDPLITCSCKVTRQIKYVMFLLPWATIHKIKQPFKQVLTRIYFYRLNTLHLYYHNSFGH